MGIVISQALDNTTAQINLLDQYDIPSETNVPITFYDEVSGKVKKQLVHTLNYLGNPDTVYLDPLVTYRMTVHSIPEKTVEHIQLAPGKHNQIGVKMPQGKLELTVGARGVYENLKCIVRQHDAIKILNVQDFNTTQRYLAGHYDLEILTLPRYTQNDLNIEAGKTTTIGIPPPGKVNFTSTSPGYGAVLVEKGNQLEWVVNLDENASRQSLNLQPGNYRVVFRSKSSQKSEYSSAKAFTITSGGTTIVKLN